MIQNCTGACFQPSIEDIGRKVCVHALPHDLDTGGGEQDTLDLIGDGKYVGMPLFAEIGPLTLDPIMEREVEQMFKQISNDLDFPLAFRSPRGGFGGSDEKRQWGSAGRDQDQEG